MIESVPEEALEEEWEAELGDLSVNELVQESVALSAPAAVQT